MFNSVSYGVAEWHAGKGLVTCLRWENEEESKRGGIDFPEAAVDEFRTLAMAAPASAPNG